MTYVSTRAFPTGKARGPLALSAIATALLLSGCGSLVSALPEHVPAPVPSTAPDSPTADLRGADCVEGTWVGDATRLGDLLGQTPGGDVARASSGTHTLTIDGSTLTHSFADLMYAEETYDDPRRPKRDGSRATSIAVVNGSISVPVEVTDDMLVADWRETDASAVVLDQKVIHNGRETQLDLDGPAILGSLARSEAFSCEGDVLTLTGDGNTDATPWALQRVP